ncbi:MAG TPA: carboxypeptidase-like regulatory domain-containing protein [Paludibacteraceae bacterium]|nr:carboxypeptidase-like regulatory domain-containing protein [Paludibacteraceae bacterium]
MNKRLSFLFCFFVVTLILTAQNKVRIFGYVVDSNNRGIELVNVFLKGTTTGTTTNQNGYYELITEIKDSAEIIFSMVGYQTVSYTIHPKAKVIQLTVELPALNQEIKEIDIIGQKRQTNTIDVLNPSKYRLMPNPSGGIESLLIAFTGVTSSNELSSQYNVRGGNFDENIVYVNGIEIYRPLLIRAGQQEGLSFINSDMVQNVSFSSGGFGVEYGDKMSSVLDIQYKKPTRTEASVSLNLLGASAYVGTASKRFTQMHGIRYKTSAYLLGTLETKGEYNPSYVDYQTYMTYQLKPKWELTFLGNFSQNSYQFIPQTRETSFGTYNMGRKLTVFFGGQEKDLFQTAFGAFTLNYHPLKETKLSLIASGFRTNEKETYDISGEYILSEIKMEDDLSKETGETLGIGNYHEHARNRLNATVMNISHQGESKAGNHQLKWGALLQFEKINDKINEWEWRDSSGYSLPYHPYDVKLYYNLKALNSLSSTRSSVFLQDTYRYSSIAGTLSFTGGLRASYWSFNDEFLLSPRLSFSYLPHWEKDFSFRFATGIYYQSPFYKEIRDTITDNLGNVNVALNSHIKSPRSVHFVLGGDYYFRALGRPFKFTTETYLKLTDRLISYSIDNVKIVYSGKNDGKAYTAGIDFKLFGELVPGTDSWINFSLMRSREDLINDSYVKNTYDENGNLSSSEIVNPGWIPGPNEQRYSFSMMFQDYLPTDPRYKLQLKFIWSDGLPFGPPRNYQFRSVFRMPPYRRVDIGASRLLVNGKDKWMEKTWLKPVKDIWLNVEVFNLLDFKNVNSYYWVTDVYGQQLAVPNYLTGRQFNIKLIVDFK